MPDQDVQSLTVVLLDFRRSTEAYRKRGVTFVEEAKNSLQEMVTELSDRIGAESDHWVQDKGGDGMAVVFERTRDAVLFAVELVLQNKQMKGGLSLALGVAIASGDMQVLDDGETGRVASGPPFHEAGHYLSFARANQILCSEHVWKQAKLWVGNEAVCFWDICGPFRKSGTVYRSLYEIYHPGFENYSGLCKLRRQLQSPLRRVLGAFRVVIIVLIVLSLAFLALVVWIALDNGTTQEPPSPPKGAAWPAVTSETKEVPQVVGAMEQVANPKVEQVPVPVQGNEKATSELPPISNDTGKAVHTVGERLEINNIAFRYVPKGTFTMAMVGRVTQNAHGVTISHGFWLSETEVTQELFASVMKFSPSMNGNEPRFPVDSVTWENAMAFCSKLAEGTGRKMRLPTQAEWEYACRAGAELSEKFGRMEGDLPGDIKKMGVFRQTQQLRGQPSPMAVASKVPNQYGLYDMHGNVAELCIDGLRKYEAGVAVSDPRGHEVTGGRSQCIARGGTFRDNPELCSSYAYDAGNADASSRTVGFRVLMEE